MASQLFDPNLVARVLGERCQLNSYFFRLRDAVADGLEMLLDRNASQDRERARGFLNAALDGYTRIGMPRHVEITRALLDRSDRT